MHDAAIRLTDLAHGAGCGCKLSPAVLRDILAKMPTGAPFPSLLVGTETSDDAAVYKINEHQAVVATTDFFTPVVNNPRDFGRIAATNALSDVYAMGATPILALAIVGMPVDRLPAATIAEILAGGASVCSEAGIPVAGGHSIDSPEPIYGLAVIGLVDPSRVLKNSTARADDRLILTKRLGVGILSAAFKRGQLDDQSYGEMLASTTQLNSVGAQLPGIPGVHAITDVTGFGILGHALEICRGASLGAEIAWDRLPFFPAARRYAEAGITTGASKRNWTSYGGDVNLPEHFQEWQRLLLCDPQTSGGLLIACAPEAEAETMALLLRTGFFSATSVGSLRAGPAKVAVVQRL
jgi:selenide,water dikinase